MAQQLPVAVAFYSVRRLVACLLGGVRTRHLRAYSATGSSVTSPTTMARMHFEVRGAAVQGRNVRFTSLLTMGECWHNNHHAFPGSARLGLYPGEWDPGWWVLSILRRAGLVRSVRLPEDLPARIELVALDPQNAARQVLLAE